MVSLPETLTTPKVCLAIIQTRHGVDPTFLQLEQLSPGAHQAVSQQNVAWPEVAPHASKQAQFPLTFTRVTSNPQVDDRSTGQRHDRTKPGDWKSQSGFLVIELRILGLIF